MTVAQALEHRGLAMRRLRIFEHISLDGVIQIGGTGEDGDFPYGDWTAPYRTSEGREAVLAMHGERFDLLLGRRTYDMWSGYWPKAPGSPMAERLNAATKFVVTHRPDSLAWVNKEVVDTNFTDCCDWLWAQGPGIL
jgi:dihydrofolate reductase